MTYLFHDILFFSSIYIIAHIAGNFSVYAWIACLFVWPSIWPQLTSYYCIFRLESMIDRMRAMNGMNFGMTFSMHTASSLVRPSGNASLAVDPIMIVRWLRGRCALEHRQSTELERRFRCSYLWGARRKCVNKLVFVIFVRRRCEIEEINILVVKKNKRNTLKIAKFGRKFRKIWPKYSQYTVNFH